MSGNSEDDMLSRIQVYDASKKNAENKDKSDNLVEEEETIVIEKSQVVVSTTPVKENYPEVSEPIEEEPQLSVEESYEEREYTTSVAEESTSKTDKRAEESSQHMTASELMDSIDSASVMSVLSYFTILGNKKERNIKAINDKLFLSPIAGFLISLVAMIVVFISTELLQFGAMSVAVLALSAIFILNGFFNSRCLARFGDGFLCPGNPEKCSRVMKDTAIGAGALGVVLVIYLVTLGMYAEAGLFLAFCIGAVEITAYNAMVATASFGSGEGISDNTNKSSLIKSSIISIVLLLVTLGVVLIGFKIAGLNYNNAVYLVFFVTMLIALAASILLGKLISYYAAKKFGSVGEESIVATVELSRAFLFIIVAISIFLLIHLI